MQDSTTVARLAHLDQVRGELAGLASTDRALAACGGRGSAAEICMIPDLTLPPLDQWTTLLTVAVDTEGFALEVFPGRPDEVAAMGVVRF
jgi:isopenicillin-N N-acyltransferase-like protein